MLFKSVNQVNGDSTRYGLSPAVKVYTLRDVGFTQSNAGDFVMKHPLGTNHAPKLKIVVQPDLKQFKMDIIDNQGFRKVNIFDGKHPVNVKQFRYLIMTLILRKVLQRE